MVDVQQERPLVTVTVPSFNQGAYLEHALVSIFNQNLPVEVFVQDGGSSDESVAVIKKWQHLLAGWRSHADNGQAAAINEGIARGTAPYVAWLNSDDWYLPGALTALVEALEKNPQVPAAYGRAWNVSDRPNRRWPVWVEPFNERRLALRCIISQPATLIRRSSWEKIGGVDPALHMVMDYDLWWRLYLSEGNLIFVDAFVAVNREHDATKTRNLRRLHYQEAIDVVRRHYGRVPWKWWLAQPYAVWYKTMLNKLSRGKSI